MKHHYSFQPPITLRPPTHQPTKHQTTLCQTPPTPTPTSPPSAPSPPTPTSTSTSTSTPTTSTTITFKNFAPNTQPLQTTTSAGRRLLDIGDDINVHIPRGCQTGICGTCTVDINNKPARACQYKPREGDKDIEVDCWRMGVQEEKAVDPMRRFAGVEEGVASLRGGGFEMRGKIGVCEECEGCGEVDCTSCEGDGFEWSDRSLHCMVCAGRKQICCAFCQGSGFSSLRAFV